MDDEWWRLSRVKQSTGHSTSTLYRLIKAGEFPAPVKIGPNAVAWPASAILAWKQKRLAESAVKRTPFASPEAPHAEAA